MYIELRDSDALREIFDYSTSNYNSREYFQEEFELGCYESGIKEYDHPREIIVDLSRSIYREIHNLFNPVRWQRSDSGRAPGKSERDCVARVKKIDRSANTRT